MVSKHLHQLMDAGLVREITNDDRNIIYAVNTEDLAALSKRLTEVLRGH